MKNEEKPTKQEIEEYDELVASIEKDDYFSKRKNISIREGVYSFLLSSFLIGFLCGQLYWREKIQVIDEKLISFFIVTGVLTAIIESCYVVGKAIYAILFLVAVAISWLVVYGLFG